MDDLKEQLKGFAARLEELESHARKLTNQNFADIVASAKGRVLQLTQHPDVEAVHAQMSGGEGTQQPNFDPTAGAERTDAPPVQPTFDRK